MEPFHKINFWIHSKQSIIVSGADTTHYRSLIQLLDNLQNNLGSNSNFKVIIWDLGLNADQIHTITLMYSKLCIIRKFNFQNYPYWFDIRINAGEYAWKPNLINETMQSTKRKYLIWLDSGNLIADIKAFRHIFNEIKHSTIYSPISDGNVSDWTYPAVLENLGVNRWDFDPTELPNRNAAILGFDISNHDGRDFINSFAKLSQNKNYIAPEGSSRENHRQDQALFTLLYYKFKYRKKDFEICDKAINQYGITIHNDID